ncbi:MAG: hypothetical protein KDI47_08635 [Gammaproteobacteria bacterium]|nr:hypothetical protein [Gammaproteobacteria bacterium]
MDRKLIFGIIALTLITLALAIVLPGGRSIEQKPKLPWIVTLDEAGFPTVFGLTIGKSTLQAVRHNFQEQGVTSLFISPAGKLAVETYFQALYLSGLKADIVVTLDLQQAQLDAIYNRGLRISQLESGAKKVKLSEQDLDSLAQGVIGHITYIPAADLAEELIRSRFGEPQNRIAEQSGLVHWLYPEKGLDIALNPDGKEVFQYVLPARFAALIAPLLDK